MSIASLEYLSILQTKALAGGQSSGTENYTYSALLEYVRKVIAEKHSEDLASVLDSADAALTLKALILKYCVQELAGKEFNQEKLVERIYQDMAGLGVLTEYLYDPNVEEVNINSYKQIEINYPDKIKYLYDEDAFPSPTAALDIVKRMVHMGGIILDAKTPEVDSYIGEGTRISAKIPPIVPKECGVIASIRKQIKSNITREQLLEAGSVSADILDFLTCGICNGISIGLAGGTGSGKTTDQAFLLNEYIRKNEDYNNRVYIIEDSRELNLIEYDSENDRPARVLYNVTKSEPNPINMFDLVVSSLRFNPSLIVPAEVRDGAAYQAACAGKTGHTILTAFHANSAQDAYKRLAQLCRTAQPGLSEEYLLEMCVEAWPIMVYKERLKDNSRKYMQVFEATGVENGKLKGHMLYKFITKETVRDECGHIVKIKGEHERVGTISPELFSRLRKKGVLEAELYRLFPDAKPSEED